MEPGTLYQLRNLIHRRNVKPNPKVDVNSSEDFVEVITIGHVLSAVMSHLKISSFDEVPAEQVLSPNLWMEDDSVRKQVLNDNASSVVNKYVHLSTIFKESESDKSISKVSTSAYDYACEALTLGLLIFDFKDAIREGDGGRVLSVWKYLFLLFKATGKRNYAMEAFTLLTQCYFLLPPNIAEQLKWSRFVNFYGLPGRNVSCDLHMEHLNRLVKTAIDGLGANKTENAISRASKAMGVIAEIIKSYDSSLKVCEASAIHHDISFKNDLKKISDQFMECDVFNPTKSSRHKSYDDLAVSDDEYN